MKAQSVHHSQTLTNYLVMNSYIQVVGRLAELRNIVSRPELNGAYVLIQAYLPDSDAPLNEDAILEFHDIRFVGSRQNNQCIIATCTTG